MKIATYLMLSFGLLLTAAPAHSKNIITFFIQPYPSPQKIGNQEKFQTMLHVPGVIARKAYKALLKTGTWQGVLASYMGYITPSDYDGQIIFPRMHQKDEVQLLVTQLIEPVMMLGATVHHFVTLKTIPAQLYSIERKQDPDTGIYFWDTNEKELPENRIISLDTIVLFAKPKNIVVPTGITETVGGPMLMLPDIYARKELNGTINALRALKIRNFFAPVTYTYKQQTPTEFAKLPL